MASIAVPVPVFRAVMLSRCGSEKTTDHVEVVPTRLNAPPLTGMDRFHAVPVFLLPAPSLINSWTLR